MRKTLITIGLIIICLYAVFHFYLRERYFDILHTSVSPSEFSSDIQGVEEMLKWYVNTYHIPAVSAAVIDNGKVVKYISTGSLSKANKSSVDENSIYRIASTGKMMIAIIARQLDDEGVIDLNQSINFYLEDELQQEAKSKLKSIKLRNLLLHNSGLGRDWHAFSKEDIINALNNNELDFQTGEKWAYSNFGYALLTTILEKATGLNYAELLQKYISHKFQISQISATLNEGYKDKYVTPYFPEFKLLKGEDIDYGQQTLTSGIYTNIKSLSALMIQQIEAYQAEDSIKNISPLVLNKEKINSWSERSFYGYGIFEHHFELKDFPGIKQTILEHSGDADGFACHYGFFPNHGFGLVVLSSSGGKWFSNMTRNMNALLIREHQRID